MTNTNTLERQIAYMAARSDIESFCERGRYDESGLWIDVTSCADEDADVVAMSLMYLTLIERVEFCPGNHNFIRILDDVNDCEAA